MTAQRGQRVLAHRAWGRAAVACALLLAVLLVTAFVRPDLLPGGRSEQPPVCPGRQYVAGGTCWVGSAP